MLNLRDEILNDKVEEIQKSLEAWAKFGGILNIGERIVFSMYIEGVPTVVREASGGYWDMHPGDFFSIERLIEFGPPHSRAIRIRNCILNECNYVDPKLKTMREFLQHLSSSHVDNVAKLLHIPNFGKNSASVAIDMILSANLPFEGGQEFLLKHPNLYKHQGGQ